MAPTRRTATPMNPPVPPSPSRPPGKRAQLAGAFGNILEWYDFAVFGFLAPVMSPLFFPASDAVAGLLKTYGIFAAGYFMRPLGGVVLGWIGDRLGRKRSLQISIFLMAVPTVLVGLLPTHAALGAGAALLLILLRLVQGISVGGELIGSAAYLVETAPPGKRGLTGSLSVSGAVGGILLGSLVVTVLTALLPEAAMSAWGWRLPFLFGAVIFGAGFWLRRHMPETEAFESTREEGGIRRNPVADVLRHHLPEVFHLVLILLLYASCFYTLFVWMPAYLQDFVEPPVDRALTINTLAMVVLVLTIPLMGWLSDRIGRRLALVLAIAAFLLLVYPLFQWIDTGRVGLVLAAQLIFAVIVAGIQGPTPATMIEMFPPENRLSGVGLAYNVALALFGGTSPMVCTWLIAVTGLKTAPAFYLITLGVISLFALVLASPRRVGHAS